MHGIGRFMPQKVAICAGFKHFKIITARIFAERQRYCTIRKTAAYFFYCAADFSDRKHAFTALKHKSTKTKRITLPTTVKDLLFR